MVPASERTDRPGSADAPEEPRRLVFGFGTAVAVVLTVLLAVVLGGAVSAASQPLAWGLACVVVAGLARPLVDGFGRHMSNGLAVLLTLLVLLVVFGGAWLGTVATVTDNVETLTEEAPAAAAEIEADNQTARDFAVEERVTVFVDELDSRLGRDAQAGKSASTISSYLVSGILVIFLIAYGPRFKQGALNQIDDPGRRRRAAVIADEAVSTWQRSVGWAIGWAVAVTMVSWLALWALDLPAPFVLGLIIGLFSLIPYVGILIGGVSTLLFAVATADTGRIVAVLALLVALQLFEALVVRRRVDPATVYVGPALPLIVMLIGWSLYGLGGAICSVLLLMLVLAVGQAVAAHPAEEAETPAALAATASSQ